MPATTLLIAAWTAGYLWQLGLDPIRVVEAQRAFGVRPAAVLEGFRSMVDPAGGWLGRLQGFRECAVPLLTYQFLHGSPLHLLGNALCFRVFGGRLEARAGATRLLVFTLCCGAVAGLVQVQGEPTWIPTIGASGAVAGALGAYLLLHPRARILILIPVVVVPVFVEIPVLVLVLAFLALQLPALQVLTLGSSTPVAYLAHLGGAGAGVLLAPLVHRRHRQPTPEDPDCRPSSAPGSPTC